MVSSRYFTVEEANALVPTLRSLFGTIMVLRSQLKTIFQRLEAAGHPPSEPAPSLGDAMSDSEEAGLPPDVGRDRLVFHAMAETLREYVEQVLATGCVVKDIEIGLVDWLGQHDGRDVWLCWKYGESRVGFWHDHNAGFSARRPVSELLPDPHRR